jgi:hypothetical protein
LKKSIIIKKNKNGNRRRGFMFSSGKAFLLFQNHPEKIVIKKNKMVKE